MGGLEQFKCPACGGAIEFDAGTQKMKCPYCDSEFDIEAIKEMNSETSSEFVDDITWESAGSQWQEGETEGMRVYTCESCAGEIIGDENLGSTTCPYCGNKVVMTGQFTGALKPDYVIPFKFDKKQAMKNFESFVNKRKYVPKRFKSDKHIEEIKGVYVPFWLFDGDAEGDMSFNAEKINTWTEGDYEYTETEHFNVTRSGNVSFNNIPVDGSEKLADDLMESIEPFHFDEAVDFETAYLAGYLADKYDVDEAASESRANERIKYSVEEALGNTVVGYSRVSGRSSNITITSGKAKYALYPVWLLSATYKGDAYTFAMNGQTGKFAGDLPVDNKGLCKFFGMMTLIWTAVIYGGSLLIKFLL